MFQSGLIEEPIVQTYDNEDYLEKGFDGSYNTAGTVFIESSASSESQNITLFGHYVYYDSSLRFSPLEQMTDQKGYEDNQIVYLFLKNEMRTYLVSSVFFITEEEAEYYDYSCPDMTREDFMEWVSFINMKNIIDPIGGKVEVNDKLLTLQTCKKWDQFQRELVICREISRTDW
ncbi:MAG: class B sortase [Solobacterium sp.]|nr:class B sortase [Solobacterium sp.]